HVIAIYGSEPRNLESAIDAALANSDALNKSPGIAAVKDQIVPNALGIVYLPVTRWASLAQAMLMPPTAGEPPRPPIANAPPIVVSGGVSGTSSTGKIHAPVATIISLKDAYTRLQASPAPLPAAPRNP